MGRISVNLKSFLANLAAIECSLDAISRSSVPEPQRTRAILLVSDATKELVEEFKDYRRELQDELDAVSNALENDSHQHHLQAAYDELRATQVLPPLMMEWDYEGAVIELLDKLSALMEDCEHE